jgi:hypothetical protein
VAPCRSCKLNRRFGGTCRLHLQGRKIRERGTSVELVEADWATSRKPPAIKEQRAGGREGEWAFPHPPITFLYLLWPALLLAGLSTFFTGTTPLLSIDFPCGPLSLPPSVLILLGFFRLVAQSAATYSRWFLARGFLYSEDRGDTFLRNVGSIRKIYTALHPRRRHSS